MGEWERKEKKESERNYGRNETERREIKKIIIKNKNREDETKREIKTRRKQEKKR